MLLLVRDPRDVVVSYYFQCVKRDRSLETRDMADFIRDVRKEFNVPDMPFVIGVGEKCDPATDLDGETYDGLEGLLNPVGAKLVPKNYPTAIAPGSSRAPDADAACRTVERSSRNGATT